jgi:hypothetical protein
MADIKIKEIIDDIDNDAKKHKVIFADADNNETEILFEGAGKIKTAVEV